MLGSKHSNNLSNLKIKTNNTERIASNTKPLINFTALSEYIVGNSELKSELR